MRVFTYLFILIAFPLEQTHAGMSYYCEPGKVPGLNNCVSYPDSKKEKCPKTSPAHDFGDLEKLVDAGPKADYCSDHEWALANQKSPKEIRQTQKSLKKECRAKAKQFKKAVLQDLMERQKFGQALKILLKRKKHRTETTVADEETNTITLDGKTLNQLNDEQLSQLVMDEIEKQHPGLKRKSEELMKSKPSFKYGFHENERVPINVMIKTEGGSCISKPNDLDPIAPYTPKECPFCKVQPAKNNFVNDCSYMVTKDFPQSKVDRLIGIGNQNRNQYCQKNLESGHDSDMSDIDNAAKQICDIAKQGMEPDFNIQTSRNLYTDKTPELAKKRGTFIQKYIRDRLMNECELPEVPGWLSVENEFTQKVKWSPPYYDGAKEGDYGPDPNAPKEARADQVTRFRNTLVKEKTDLEKRIANLTGEIAVLKKDSDSRSSELNTLYSDYSKLQKKASNGAEDEEDKKAFHAGISENMRSIADRVEDAADLRNSALQQISDLETEKKSIEEELAKHSDSAIQTKIDLLNQFYTDKDTSGSSPGFHEKWDQQLFNDFKMVRISGKAAKNSSQMVTNTQLDPKLDVMLNMITQTDEFICIVEPFDTKTLKLSGYLKGAGQLLVGSMVIAGGIGLTGGAAALGVFNTTLSLLCMGCSTPGKNMPTWRLVGNLFETGSKSGRKAVWHRIKEKTGELITMNGKLALNSDNYTNVHNYNDFAAHAERYYGEDFGKKSRTDAEFKIVEIKDEKGKLTSTEKYDQDGVLLEVIEYDEKGNIIETYRFNKDGQEIEE